MSFLFLRVSPSIHVGGEPVLTTPRVVNGWITRSIPPPPPPPPSSSWLSWDGRRDDATTSGSVEVRGNVGKQEMRKKTKRMGGGERRAWKWGRERGRNVQGTKRRRNDDLEEVKDEKQTRGWKKQRMKEKQKRKGEKKDEERHTRELGHGSKQNHAKREGASGRRARARPNQGMSKTPSRRQQHAREIQPRRSTCERSEPKGGNEGVERARKRRNLSTDE